METENFEAALRLTETLAKEEKAKLQEEGNETQGGSSSSAAKPKTKLTKPGEKLPTTPAAVASTAEGVQLNDRVLVEWMCDKDSSVCAAAEGRATRTIRITEESCDVDTPEGFNAAKRVVEAHGSKVDLLLSIPCKYWCAWHRVNASRYGEEYREWLYQMRLKTKLQLRRAIIVGNIVLDAGGRVIFEWPRYCDGHSTNELRQWVAERGLYVVDIDGCTVGVEDGEGNPILKPWRLYNNDQHFTNFISDFRCSGDHKHTKCAGSYTNGTGYCTEEMAEALLQGWQYPEIAGKETPAMICQSNVLDPIEKRPHDMELQELILSVVARLVSYKELNSNPDAAGSIQKEYNKLRSWPVWDEDAVGEMDDVM